MEVGKLTWLSNKCLPGQVGWVVGLWGMGSLFIYLFLCKLHNRDLGDYIPLQTSKEMSEWLNHKNRFDQTKSVNLGQLLRIGWLVGLSYAFFFFFF